MTDKFLWAGVAAAALMAAIGTGAQAQTTTFDIEDAATDVVDEIRDDIDDDFERDLDVVGNTGRELGYSGSVGLRATATSGNDEDTDVGIAARYGFFDGVNGGEINFAYTYSREGNSTPVQEETSFYLSTEYTRNFSDRFFAYAQGVAVFDDFGGEVDDLEDDEVSGNREDIFAGVGLGYQIATGPRFSWGLQAGPGYRWLETFDVADSDPNTPGDQPLPSRRIEEEAISLSSDLLYQISDTTAISNDTDLVASDETTTVTNDLALSVALNESLSLRTNLLTEFNSNPAPGVEDTDNTLGVAVVYSF